jgi:hypothetical protein
MKKISTATVKAFRKKQKLTIGLDLDDRSSWYCVLDETGQVVLEQKVGTTPKAMQEVFGGMARSRIALETGVHSPWVKQQPRESVYFGSSIFTFSGFAKSLGSKSTSPYPLYQ